MDWTQFYTIIGLIIAQFAGMLGLFLWNRSEANADRRDILQIVRSIEQEMKDFHGRLERQDAEFKSHMQYYHSSKE